MRLMAHTDVFRRPASGMMVASWRAVSKASASVSEHVEPVLPILRVSYGRKELSTLSVSSVSKLVKAEVSDWCLDCSLPEEEARSGNCWNCSCESASDWRACTSWQ